MPELCGSTTVKASITAIAASVAEPPFAKIASPAAVARGSAALTAPRVSALVEAVAAEVGALYSAQPVKATAKARQVMSVLVMMPFALFASNRFGNVGKSIAAHEFLEFSDDPRSKPRAFVDHCGV